VFSYRNYELLSLLKDRGRAIKNLRWENVDKINTELTWLVRSKYDLLTTPNVAFVTMKTEKGARDLFQLANINILGTNCTL